MESYGGVSPRPRTSTSSRRPCMSATPSRAGSGAFVYDGMRAMPLSTSAANFTRSLRKAASFAHKKPPPSSDAPPPRRALSSKENTSSSNAGEASTMMSPRRSMPEPGAASRGPWEPTSRRRRSASAAAATTDDAGAGKASGAALREMLLSPARRKEEAEKEEAAHTARMLTARLLQWRFANARMEKAMARATSAAENKLFYTWLRVAELRNIQAAKRIVAQRRRQKLKLARLLRPQLPLLASWEHLSKPNADATAGLASVLSTACTNLPLAAGAQADVESMREAVSSCVGTVDEIEAVIDMFYATAGATSGTLGELARTIQQEVECLEEATRLSSIVTGLQMKEVSLRANLIQAKQRLHLGPAAAVAPAFATSGWCF